MLSNQLGYGVYEFIDILIVNQGTSQGKSSVFNGYLKFMGGMDIKSGKQGRVKGS